VRWCTAWRPTPAVAPTGPRRRKRSA
jgi:hypothetical protein